MTRFASSTARVCPADTRVGSARASARAGPTPSRRRASSMRRSSPAPTPSAAAAALAPPRASSSGPSTASPRHRSIKAVGGTRRPVLRRLGGQVADRSRRVARRLARRPEVVGISLDRPVHGTTANGRRPQSARAWVSEQLGSTARDVGVATIDSGVNAVARRSRRARRAFRRLRQRPASAVRRLRPRHARRRHHRRQRPRVERRRRGIAPGAHLVVLKALDVAGDGFTSNVIAAHRLRDREPRAPSTSACINLSVAAGVYESFTKDPLTLAAKRAVDAGIVVVAAAGNRGRNAAGTLQYGGIASPATRRGC